MDDNYFSAGRSRTLKGQANKAMLLQTSVEGKYLPFCSRIFIYSRDLPLMLLAFFSLCNLNNLLTVGKRYEGKEEDYRQLSKTPV